MVFYSVASVQNAAQRKSEATRIVASQRSSRRDAKKGWCGTGKVLTVTRTSVQDFFLASISMIRSTSSPIAPSEIGALESISSSRERATKAGQYAAAIAALIAKAKLVGRWVERSEQKNSNVNYVMSDKPMTEEEWAERCVTEH